MDNYDSLLLQLAAPLVFVDLETPVPISEKIKHNLHRSIAINNIDTRVWDNCIILNRLNRAKYRFQYRKYEAIDSKGSSKLSPFHPESDIYPNGIISSKWFEKYMKDIPFAVITVYQLSEDPAHDIRIINEINNNGGCGDSFTQISVLACSQLKDMDRIDKIKLVIHTKMVYLIDDSQQLPKDTDVLVSSLINSLKQSSHSFYSGLETRIRNRNSKFYAYPSEIDHIDTKITISPKILETRNLIKQAMVSQFSNMQHLEPSIKLLEAAYQAQIALLKQHIDVFEDAPSTHDQQLYFQLRTAIDITAFHIVRAHLSLEDPINALKKHQAHIMNVQNVVKTKTNESNWQSIQYEWLADLLSLVPDSIIQAIQQYHPSSKKAVANQKMVHFFGGFQLKDKNMTIITESAFIYSKSYDCLKSLTTLPEPELIYMSCKDSSLGLTKKRATLLENALSALSTNSLELNEEEDYKHFIAYLNWQVAQEYLQMSDDTTVLVKASNLLKTALSHFQDNHWSLVKEKIIEKLIEIGIKLDSNPEQVVLFTLKLLRMKNLFSITKHFEFQFPSEFTMDINVPYFDTTVLLAPQFGAKDIRINDVCFTQIELKPTIHRNTFHRLFPGSEYSLVINQLDVEYTRVDGRRTGTKSFPSITLNHDPTRELLKVTQVDDSNELNLSFDGMENKVILYSQEADCVGHHKIQTLRFQSTLVIKNEKFVLILHSSWEDNLDQINRTNQLVSTNFYQLKALHPTKLRLNGRMPHTIKISPLVPDVTIDWNNQELSNITIGEKVEIPLAIEYKKPHKHAYNSIKLQANVGVLDSNSRLSTRSYWEGFKDDESIPLDVGHTNVRLFISLIGPSEVTDNSSSVEEVTINLKVLIVDEEETDEADVADELINDSGYDLSVVVEPISMVFDIKTYGLPIISSPFNAKFVILPRYRSEPGFNDMPVPFILDDHAHDSKSSYSMPAVTRVWLGSLSLLEPKLKNIKIDDVKFSMTTSNQDMMISKQEQNNNNMSMFTELFSTKSKMGFSHRNVMILTNATLKYHRLQTPNITNEYTTRNWDILLPLSDPRVLVTLTNVNKTLNTVTLKYIIENPSPRVFTFNTELQLDELSSSSWTLDEELLLLPPLKQFEMPVMPFNRHVVEFKARYNDFKHNLTPLPLFKVYDVHYHVWLPTLSVDSNLFIYNKRLHWQINGHS
ncbi:uncharacterized protein KQ657_002743 [Scheffersomyces spartinae]|uniref:Uncharacterized protein n=1 Tax=Scheffersomyces spartinae TaxID=45513 RepID=A0A9P7V5K1_9ASCO|nr:uncharacterized protein KQ657_002743 [Scheffersomyces spartinae]KAG7191778.1 hypothetical protein KQ657_002743 [Scheffersomyces spartinae]